MMKWIDKLMCKTKGHPYKEVGRYNEGYSIKYKCSRCGHRVNITTTRVMKDSVTDEEMLLKRKFEQKWDAFIKSESCVYYRAKIRAIRQDKKLILIHCDGLDQYVQLYFDDNEQFDKLYECFKDMSGVRIFR